MSQRTLEQRVERIESVFAKLLEILTSLASPNGAESKESATRKDAPLGLPFADEAESLSTFFSLMERIKAAQSRTILEHVEDDVRAARMKGSLTDEDYQKLKAAVASRATKLAGG